MAHEGHARTEKQYKTPREDIYLGWLILFLLVVVGIGTYFGWGMKKAVVPVSTVTVDDVLSQPLNFIGGSITIGGSVAKIVGPHAFTISNPPAGKDNLLVVRTAPDTLNLRLDVGDHVQVTGSVHAFDIGRFQQDFKVDLDSDLLRKWQDKPVIASSEIRKFP